MVVDFEENKDEAGVQRRKPHGLCIAINTAHRWDCGDHAGFWDMVTVKRMPGLGLTSANSCQFCPKDYGPQDRSHGTWRMGPLTWRLAWRWCVCSRGASLVTHCPKGCPVPTGFLWLWMDGPRLMSKTPYLAWVWQMANIISRQHLILANTLQSSVGLKNYNN